MNNTDPDYNLVYGDLLTAKIMVSASLVIVQFLFSTIKETIWSSERCILF